MVAQSGAPSSFWANSPTHKWRSRPHLVPSDWARPVSSDATLSGTRTNQPIGSNTRYWVLTKLAINVIASVVLLIYMQTLGRLADVAAATSSGADLAALRGPSPVLHAGAALILLLAAAALSVYKPPGLTRYGWRKRQELRTASQP